MSEWVTGRCKYAYNASEQYRMQAPGSGIESHCGCLTYPQVDEPEIVPVTIRPAEGNPYVSFQRTGRKVPREKADPYCPKHGGTEPPPEPSVDYDAVVAAHEKAVELAERYKQQIDAVTPQLEITEGVTEDAELR